MLCEVHSGAMGAEFPYIDQQNAGEWTAGSNHHAAEGLCKVIRSGHK